MALKPATEETIKAALERLEKDNGGKLKSQYAIKGDGIELNLNNNPSLRDLGALSGLPLVKLELQYADVADLRPLVGMPLAYLDIEGNKVENIKPLSKIKTLNSLNMSFTRMYDLNPLKGLQLIKFVWVDSKGIRDLTPFAGMPLESLSVSFSDSTSPKEMAANIAVMKDMPLAVYLSLGGAVIKDIKFLETFLSSKSLTLVSTQVSDLSPLRGMKSLHSLRLGDNRKVVDFKALKGINLNILYIINMDITSLEPLAERGKLITYLTILACPKLTDTDKIPEYFPNLSFITIDPDFPRPEILTRCAKLNQIRFKEGAPFMTMEEFRKQFSKPAKQPGQK